MLPRVLLIVTLLLVFLLAMQGCNPGMDYYTSMQVQKLDGQSYLILENMAAGADGAEPYFSIYQPGNNGPVEWKPVTTDRLGHALGIFRVKVSEASGPVAPVTPPARAGVTPPKSETPISEVQPVTIDNPPVPSAPPAPPAQVTATSASSMRLGIFHGDNGSTRLDLAANPPTSTYKRVDFNWIPLTTSEFNGVTYAFGVDRFELNDKRTEAPLRVARLDGETWTDLNLSGPAVKLNTLKAFSLDALALDSGIKVLWRNAVEDPGLLEGPRYTTDGPLAMVSFDGKDFEKNPPEEGKEASGKIINVPKLPKGNASIWVEQNEIHALIQTRPKDEQSLSMNSPMEIWTIQADGESKMIERIEGSQSKPGLMAFIAAEHFTDKGQEYILRSNWQTFEVWQRVEGTFKMIRANPPGLPTYDLESVLWTGLAGAGALVLFGAFLAWRRRQAWTLMRRIQAHEIYATVGSRTGAYLVDLGLIVGIAVLYSRICGSYASPFEMVFLDFSKLPYWPFFIIYMLYFSLGEWLFGTTAGKLLMGLCVVMDGGQKLSLTSALIRNLVGFVERIPQIVLVVVWPMILLTPRRQRLGDMLSRSFVVHKSALVIFKQQREQELAKLRTDALASGALARKTDETKDGKP